MASTATRMRGTPVYGAPLLRFAACLRARAATTSAAAGGSSLELSPEGGVFSNDFLIPLALDRRLRHWRHLTDRFGVLQVCVNRRHDDARLNRDEVDPDQGDRNPGVDDDPLVEHAIEDVDQACAACCTFNGHRTLLLPSRSPNGPAHLSDLAVERRRDIDASRRSRART